jgi:Cytochrome b5-like Heme/Steroid binding domain
MCLRLCQDHCRSVLGALESRVHRQTLFSFEEVQRHNAAGHCWLILDGMVLDVTRWLPEHPGGDVIIPRQARREEGGGGRGTVLFCAKEHSYVGIMVDVLS